MDIVDSIILREQIEEILENLNPEERRLVIKYIINGYTQQQISLAEGVSHQAISQKLGRMRRKLSEFRIA